MEIVVVAETSSSVAMKTKRIDISQFELTADDKRQMKSMDKLSSSTPNYKARDFNVSDALRKISKLGPLKTNSDRHLVSEKSVGATKVQFRDPTMAALDGNTVEMAVEQTSFSENATKYQATLTFLTGRIQTLRSAIKGE